MTKNTYLAAGVDLEAKKEIIQAIKTHASATLGPQVLGGVGFFGGMYQLSGYKEPVLVSSTDSVGTKVKIASLMGRYDTVGQDLVNHCINDAFTCGAEPLFFLDYISMGKLVPHQVEALVEGIALACREAGCALIGGETAELPGLYAGGDFDLVGFIVGAVEKSHILDGSNIQQGDTLLGVPSSGPHTNGYSLVRRVFDLDQDSSSLGRHFDELGGTLGDALLTTHRCYYPMLEPVLPLIQGMAHITGGGLIENVPRVIPDGLAATFDSSSWEVNPIFRLIQERGNVTREEMYRVFNMGLGMVLVCSPDRVNEVQSLVPEAKVVGEVVAQSQEERVAILDRSSRRNPS